MLLIGLPQSLLSLLSYTAQNHPPQGGTAHEEPDLATLTISQENAPAGLSRGQSDEGNFSVVIPSPQICLRLCQTDKN